MGMGPPKIALARPLTAKIFNVSAIAQLLHASIISFIYLLAIRSGYTVQNEINTSQIYLYTIVIYVRWLQHLWQRDSQSQSQRKNIICLYECTYSVEAPMLANNMARCADVMTQFAVYIYVFTNWSLRTNSIGSNTQWMSSFWNVWQIITLSVSQSWHILL